MTQSTIITPRKCVCCGLQIFICKNQFTGESVQWDHHARDSKDDQVIMIIMMIMIIIMMMMIIVEIMDDRV